jgi:hypothetical protein
LALLRGLVWLVVAALISLGAGGVVASADHPATDEARPELTARGDARMAPGLAGIAAQLRELEPDVADLSDTGRRALISLSARDTDALARELVIGDGLVDRIDQQQTAIRGLVAALPHQQGSERISRATNRRLAAIERALQTVVPLRASWRNLARAAEPATRLVVFLEDHDRQTATATSSGTKGDYAAALESLAISIADLDAAEGIRDELASRADVATLDDWLDRGRAYDEALVALYAALDASNGVVTPAARRAFADVERAQQALPLDTRALVIIMGDIAQGGLNQVVISIEQARGGLAEAITALH